MPGDEGGRRRSSTTDGYDADEIVKEYPELEREDVLHAAKYGAWLASERVSNIA